jgi:hypothetical protein
MNGRKRFLATSSPEAGPVLGSTLTRDREADVDLVPWLVAFDLESDHVAKIFLELILLAEFFGSRIFANRSCLTPAFYQ